MRELEWNAQTYRDHVSRHTVSNEEDNVLGFTLLCQVSNQPTCLGLGAVIVGQSSRVL